jgi:uncharacterized FlaG/YvyC family protein
MSEIDVTAVNALTQSPSKYSSKVADDSVSAALRRETVPKAMADRANTISTEELNLAADKLSEVVLDVTGKSLSFTIDDELSRMIISVRAVGSDEIIRQFPPEEFISVAKYIASQDSSEINEDFLKGILFDGHT